MRERRRRQGVRELRLTVPDVRQETVRARIAAQVARLDPSQESEALSFVEAISKFDASDANGK
jgi:hypothetical protein